MNLALFDFDGTITTEDSFTSFIYFSTPKPRLYIGLCLLFPIIFLYKVGLLSAATTRPIISKFAFRFRDIQQVKSIAELFVQQKLPAMMRPEALDRILWHKQQGDEILIVSATVNPYLSIWCNEQGVNFVCSELAIQGNQYAGNYRYGDCSGMNKVSAIQRKTDLSMFTTIYAYGDTHEDLPMLALANEKYYQWSKIN